MKLLILSWLLVLSVHAQAQQPQFMLDDVLSPNEIAMDLGIPLRVKPYPGRNVSFQQAVAMGALQKYPVIVRINKSATGPYAQQAWIYEKGRLTRNYPVSTGREQWELAKSGREYFSITPTGYFHPKRYVRDHYSKTWQTNMEFAIFFNGGIALHAAHPELNRYLGRRASGGCVRQHYQDAEYIYNLARAQRSSKSVLIIVEDTQM